MNLVCRRRSLLEEDPSLSLLELRLSRSLLPFLVLPQLLLALHPLELVTQLPELLISKSVVFLGVGWFRGRGTTLLVLLSSFLPFMVVTSLRGLPLLAAGLFEDCSSVFVAGFLPLLGVDAADDDPRCLLCLVSIELDAGEIRRCRMVRIERCVLAAC